jgi:hypothetical protein
MRPSADEIADIEIRAKDRDLHLFFQCLMQLKVSTFSRVSVVARTLCYKPEGRGFDTRSGEGFFSIYLILPVALGPGVYYPLTEISIRSRKIMFLVSRARPVPRANNLAAICEPIV